MFSHDKVKDYDRVGHPLNVANVWPKHVEYLKNLGYLLPQSNPLVKLRFAEKRSFQIFVLVKEESTYLNHHFVMPNPMVFSSLL